MAVRSFVSVSRLSWICRSSASVPTPGSFKPHFSASRCTCVRRDGRREIPRLALQPAVVVERRHRSAQLSEVRGARRGRLQHRVHEMVPGGPPVALGEDILRVLRVAEEGRIPPLARQHAVRAAVGAARRRAVRVAPRVSRPVIRRERVLHVPGHATPYHRLGSGTRSSSSCTGPGAACSPAPPSPARTRPHATAASQRRGVAPSFTRAIASSFPRCHSACARARVRDVLLRRAVAVHLGAGAPRELPVAVVPARRPPRAPAAAGWTVSSARLCRARPSGRAPLRFRNASSTCSTSTYRPWNTPLRRSTTWRAAEAGTPSLPHRRRRQRLAEPALNSGSSYAECALISSASRSRFRRPSQCRTRSRGSQTCTCAWASPSSRPCPTCSGRRAGDPRRAPSRPSRRT